MKKPLTLLFFLITVNLSAQHYVWETFGGYVAQGTSETGQAMVRDNAGNLYVASHINFPVALQGDTVFPLNPGLNDIYIAKFNPQGQHIWIKKFGAVANSDVVLDMAIDDSANLYVFDHSFAFDIVFEDTVVMNLANAIVFKLDSTGHFKWASQIPYTLSCGKFAAVSNNYLFVESCSGLHKLSLDSGIIQSALSFNIGGSAGMCVAPNGDIIMTHHNGTSSVSIGGITVNNIPSANGTGGNLTILRVNTALQVKSFKAYGDYVSTADAPVAADNNNVYITTPLNFTNYFGTDSIVPPVGKTSVAVLKMDTMLNPVFAKELFKSNLVETAALLMDNNGLYLGGNYGAALYLNNGDTLPPASNGDNLIVKFDYNGNAIYGTGSGRVGGTDRIYDLASDGNGTVYFSGYQGSNPVFDCITPITHEGMELVAFNDSLYIVPSPSINQNGLLLTATPNFTDTIQWYLNGVAIPSANSQQYNVTQNGIYTVVYTNRFNCSKTSNSITINNVGVNEIANEFGVMVYPNPVSDELTVSGFQFTVNDEIKIVDVVGKNIYSEKIKILTSYLKLQTSHLEDGVYFLEIISSNKKSVSKIIKSNKN